MVGSRFAVVFALYPRVTQLDFTGPFEVFARLPGAECVLASTEGGTIQADGGLTFARVARLSELAECALLCVPGGFGCIAAMEDQSYLAELRRLAALSRYVTSVCTGSLLLAKAGLLAGRRATTHWAAHDLLASLDPSIRVDKDARVVVDRIISSAGVSAGIDMAFDVVERLCGKTVADETAHYIEATHEVRWTQPPGKNASGENAQKQPNCKTEAAHLKRAAATESKHERRRCECRAD